MNITINNLKFAQNLKKPSTEKNSTNPILSQSNSYANISSCCYRPNFTGKKAEQAPSFGEMSVEQIVDFLNKNKKIKTADLAATIVQSSCDSENSLDIEKLEKVYKLITSPIVKTA